MFSLPWMVSTLLASERAPSGEAMLTARSPYWALHEWNPAWQEEKGGEGGIKSLWSGSNMRCCSTEQAMVRSKLHSHVTTHRWCYTTCRIRLRSQTASVDRMFSPTWMVSTVLASERAPSGEAMLTAHRRRHYPTPRRMLAPSPGHSGNNLVKGLNCVIGEFEKGVL